MFSFRPISNLHIKKLDTCLLQDRILFSQVEKCYFQQLGMCYVFVHCVEKSEGSKKHVIHIQGGIRVVFQTEFGELNRMPQ